MVEILNFTGVAMCPFLGGHDKFFLAGGNAYATVSTPPIILFHSVIKIPNIIWFLNCSTCNPINDHFN